MYTGNTIQRYSLWRCRPVYPCVYREHCVLLALVINLNGLSLCIQGTLIDDIHYQYPRRFIPVYTGNACMKVLLVMHRTVYPCVYRERVDNSRVYWSTVGLSLCIQGTLLAQKLPPIQLRFIPVYTGNAGNGIIVSVADSVYPCVYRERSRKTTAPALTAGLSLCIQGTPVSHFPRLVPGRFIPVYTGNAT